MDLIRLPGQIFVISLYGRLGLKSFRESGTISDELRLKAKLSVDAEFPELCMSGHNIKTDYVESAFSA